MTAGEIPHAAGEDGLQRAKEWLDLSTRVDQSWTNHERPFSELLNFSWPHAPGSFTFDLGGRLRGGEVDGKVFLAEVKAYKNESDLPSHFRNFLAKCYVALKAKPDRCGYFLWISWAPFQAQKWDQHTSAANVTHSLLIKDNRSRVLGTDDEDEAQRRILPELVVGVAERVWLITLSREQERLVLMPKHYGEMLKLIDNEKRTLK